MKKLILTLLALLLLSSVVFAGNSQECSYNGRSVQNKCKCNDGWTGETCEIPTSFCWMQTSKEGTSAMKYFAIDVTYVDPQAAEALCSSIDGATFDYEQHTYTVLQTEIRSSVYSCTKLIDASTITEVPEFGTITASIALLGAAGAYIKKKRK